MKRIITEKRLIINRALESISTAITHKNAAQAGFFGYGLRSYIFMKFRPLHRKISLWLALPLILSAASGVAYRAGRSWFGMSSKTGGDILSIHSWEWLGKVGGSVVIWLIGCGLLFLCISAAKMLWDSRRRVLHSPQKIRLWHRLVGAVFLLPLAVSAISGIAYRTGEACDMSEDTLDLLMSIHEGDWMGKDIKPFYISVLGLGLVLATVSGVVLLFRKNKSLPRK
jgi:hypothetical protein